MTLPASSFTPRRQLLSPTPRTLLGQRARRCVSQSHRRSVTRSLPYARAAAACSAPLMRRQFPTLPASRRFQGGTATPFAPRLKDGLLLSHGRGSDHEGCPSGHAFSGAFCGVSRCLMQQRRAVRATVREERDGAAGDEEPATKSRASSINSAGRETRETVRAERTGGSGAEHCRPSTISRELTNQRGAPGY